VQVTNKSSGFRFTSRRLEIWLRSLTAILGGYGLTILISSWLARFLPGSTEQVTLTAMMLSFGVFAGVFIWVFSASDIRKIWLYMLCLIILLSGSLMWSINVGGRL